MKVFSFPKTKKQFALRLLAYSVAYGLSFAAARFVKKTLEEQDRRHMLGAAMYLAENPQVLGGTNNNPKKEGHVFVYAENIKIGDIVLNDFGEESLVEWTAPVDDHGLMQIQTNNGAIVLDDNDIIVKVQ